MFILIFLLSAYISVHPIRCAFPSHRTDDVEVGVSDPCYIYGSQTLILINGGYISAVTDVFIYELWELCPHNSVLVSVNVSVRRGLGYHPLPAL